MTSCQKPTKKIFIFPVLIYLIIPVYESSCYTSFTKEKHGVIFYNGTKEIDDLSGTDVTGQTLTLKCAHNFEVGN